MTDSEDSTSKPTIGGGVGKAVVGLLLVEEKVFVSIDSSV